ncbi:hypothetical protein [Streptomyces sp. Ncost-T10-10d]|uniref:hypothetical protein n=1 Tax=Streptomyces sp. Ncost-T10-10d TaxID=1839774 RepID=UPI00081DD6C5|nr:hypothetical protein [Streptomyces sp. Ncost-T10-10d]SCF86612.1 hypothetical protein GA0115254_120072 [Streptomyces sp. Ncost-T10-10d]
MDVEVELAGELCGSVLFADLAEASRSFGSGTRCRHTRAGRHLDTMELGPGAWHMGAARVRSAAYSFFDDPDFPPGTATPDCALVMRDVQAGRHPRPARPSPSEPARRTVPGAPEGPEPPLTV